MGKLILITGGARSGKSNFAEDTARGMGENVLYIATSKPLDDEMKMRIKKHREHRPKNWETVEAYKDLDAFITPAISGKSAVLIDCITIMITNLFFDEHNDWESITDEDVIKIEASVNSHIGKLLNLVEDSSVPFILVTNEVGMGLIPEHLLGRIFRDIAGRANQMLAKSADEVFFCVSGIPMRIK